MASKKRAAPDVRTAWALVITEGVDDYKTRGEVAQSKVWLFDSERKCKEKLNQYTLEVQQEPLENYTLKEMESICKSRKGLQEAIEKYCEVETFKEGAGDDGKTWVFRKDLQVAAEDESIEALRDWAMEGEFISQKWTYEIAEKEIN